MEVKRFNIFSFNDETNIKINEERTIPLSILDDLKKEEDFSSKLSTNFDTNGGLSDEEFDDVIDYIKDLEHRNSLNELTDEEKVLSEVIFNILTKKEHNLDYNLYYNRRLGFIKANKNK